MNRKLLFLSAFTTLLTFQEVEAQTVYKGMPVSISGKIQKTKSFYQVPAVDVEAELANFPDKMLKNLRFGKEFEADINVVSQGVKTVLPNGSVVYQYGIKCDQALSVNLVFDQFYLAPGAKLYITDAHGDEFDGAYTSLNNNENNMLGTELVHSDEIIIELTEPKDQIGTSLLHVSTIVSGFRDLDELAKALNDSGDCEYDVNCSIGTGWENQRNAVAMMVNGGGFCTGSLVNNTSGTIIPYFLSANHCGTSPGSWVFRFRWETPAGSTVCGVAGTSANGPTTMNVNGGTLRASWSGSDFTLTELNSSPDPSWGIYYNGWDHSGNPVDSAVGIHHPAGDIKKISFEFDQLSSTAWAGTPANSHWLVPSWDLGVTEGGSSGSPLFDMNHRTIGQLHGGNSSCGGSDLSDMYGKFSVSWEGNGSSSTRLKDWLDPQNSGISAIDGVDPLVGTFQLDASLSLASGTEDIICSPVVSPVISLNNYGSTTLTSATINYGYDGNLNQVYNWTGSLAQYGTTTISLPSATLSGGGHTFNAKVTLPNNSTDENTANDVLASAFTTVANPQVVELELHPDYYADEVSWELTNSTGSVLYTGGNYSYGDTTTVTASFCLESGCYEFKIYDSYGDGMSGQSSSSTTDNGYYVLTNTDTVVVELAQADAEYGDSLIQSFCLNGASTAGINDLSLAASLTLYPNPADQLVSVVSNGEIMDEVEIYSLAGQSIRKAIVNSTVYQMNIADFASGVYLVKIKAGDQVAIKQLVIR